MPAMDVEDAGGPGGFVLQATRESPQETIIITGKNFRYLTTGDLVHDVPVFQPTSRRGSLLERSVNANVGAGSERPVVAAPVVLVVAAPVVLVVAAPVVLVVAAPLPPEEVSLQLECPPLLHLN
jgi:ethanolamine utilization microcompartment shell protein EutL